MNEIALPQPQFTEKVGHPLAVWLAERGLRVSGFADQIGIHRNTLYNMVNRKRATEIQIVRRVSEVTGIPMEKLI